MSSKSLKREAPGPAFLFMRAIVIPGSALFFIHSNVYYPARGIALAPANPELLVPVALTKIAVYALFLAGAFISKWQPFFAFVLLAMGLAGRVFLELTVSAGRLAIDRFPDESIESLLLLLPLLYAVTFILPALLCIDCYRLAGRRKAQSSPSPV